MAESIDYYMDRSERETIVEALRLAMSVAIAEWAKANLVYDKEAMARWEDQEIRFRDVLGQFE